MDGEQDIAGFFSEVESEEKARKAKAREERRAAREKDAPTEGSLAEAEAEGRRLTAREERRAARMQEAPKVRDMGEGPKVDPSPRCRLCGDRRWLTRVTFKAKDGSEGVLCRYCVKQVEFDRERRCGYCGTPTRHWTPGGVCPKCHDEGVEARENFARLRRMGWITQTGDYID
jgi:rubrerythrin